MAVALLTAADTAGDLRPPALAAAVIAWRAYRVQAVEARRITLFNEGVRHLNTYLSGGSAEAPVPTSTEAPAHPPLPEIWPTMLVELLVKEEGVAPYRQRIRVSHVTRDTTGTWIFQAEEPRGYLYTPESVIEVCLGPGYPSLWRARA